MKAFPRDLARFEVYPNLKGVLGKNPIINVTLQGDFSWSCSGERQDVEGETQVGPSGLCQSSPEQITESGCEQGGGTDHIS